jgi:hypothetical protein
MDVALALSLGQPSTPLPNQVAGHQGVMSDASGSLVIKVSHGHYLFQMNLQLTKVAFSTPRNSVLSANQRITSLVPLHST